MEKKRLTGCFDVENVELVERLRVSLRPYEASRASILNMLLTIIRTLTDKGHLDLEGITIQVLQSNFGNAPIAIEGNRVTTWTTEIKSEIHCTHQSLTEEGRFWLNVQKTESCWLWKTPNKAGYGCFRRSDSRPPVMAHRYAYELLVGPIAPGMTIDHLCRQSACVNPQHLEVITMRENLLRGGGAAVQSIIAKEGRKLA